MNNDSTLNLNLDQFGPTLACAELCLPAAFIAVANHMQSIICIQRAESEQVTYMHVKNYMHMLPDLHLYIEL